MTFAWASDNEALRHLSSEIIQARFHKANLTCRYYNPAIHTAAFAYHNICMMLCPHRDAK